MTREMYHWREAFSCRGVQFPLSRGSAWSVSERQTGIVLGWTKFFWAICFWLLLFSFSGI